MSKFAAIFTFVCLLASAVLFAAVMPAAFSVAEAADGGTAEYDIVYPSEGYFPVTKATLAAASASHVAVYDSALSAVLVQGADGGGAYLPLPSGATADGIWLSSSTLLVRTVSENGTAYYAADLATDPVSLVTVSLDHPSGISYIMADDERFYAKSDTTVALYSNVLTEDGLSSSRDDDIENSYVNGKYIFAAHDGKLYFFAQNYEKREYFVFNVTNDEILTRIHDTAFLPSFISYCDLGLVSAKDGELVVIDESDGSTVLIRTGIAAGDSSVFTSYGNKLYVINDAGGVDVWTLDGANASAALTDTLAMKGSAEGCFDSPSDIAFDGTLTAVADGGNSRVMIADNDGSFTYAETDGAPLALAPAGNGSFYALTEDIVYMVHSRSDIPELYTASAFCGVGDAPALDIAAIGDRLAVLTEDGVFMISSGGNIRSKTLDVRGGIAVASAYNGVVYVLTESGIYTLTASANGFSELIPFRNFDLSGASDFAVDRAGNIFVSYSDGRIVRCLNSVDGVRADAEFILSHPVAQAHPSAIALSGSKAWFASDTAFIGVAEVGAVDEDSYVPVPHPDVSESALTFAETLSDTYLFDEPGRFDTMTRLSAGTVVLCFEDASTDEEHVYAYVGGRTGYIEADALTPVSPSAKEGSYTVPAGTPLYAHPAGGQALSFSEDGIFPAADDAAGLDGGTWLRVSYDGKLYFVRLSDVREYVEVIPEKEKVFGKASADRAGGLVNVFALPDSSSAVITEIVDGTGLEILDENGEFWLVSFGSTTGYILKSDVELEGLTTVQIVSIVLCCAVAVTGAVVFVVIWQTRKKEKEKE